MPVPRAVLNMAVPTVIGQLIVLFYNMADTFFVGQTNNPYMVAGASLILPVFNITLPLAGLAGVGGGALVSRLLGRGEYAEAKRVSSFSLRLGMSIAGVFSLIMLIFMEPILHFLGAGEETYGFARGYALCVVVCGGIPTVAANVMAALLRSVGESKKAGFGVTFGGVLNMALDPLFMFVIMPKGMEIIGAGAATCLSNIVSCIYFLLVIRGLGKDSVLAGCPLRELPENESIRSIFAVGVPSSVATFLFDIDYIVIGRLMTAYGDFQMAAIGIVLKVERLPLNTGVGICQGMVPIIAYNYASGNHKRMREIASFARNIGLVCAVVSITMYEIFAPEIMRFFIKDAQTVMLGTNFLRARSLATIFMFLSFFPVHFFNAVGRGRTALFLGVTRWAVFNIPMLYILNAIFGMYGIVWAQLAADILTVTLSFIVYNKFMRSLNSKEVLQ